MLKENKGKLMLSTVITLLPLPVGCLLWNRLPDTIATHFGVNNEANGWSSKAFVVFALPLLMAGLHLLCLCITAADPKRKNIGKKPLALVFWIVPALSMLLFGSVYAMALGIQVNATLVSSLFIGVLLLVLGNQMPKAKQNYSFGLKLPWTLNDPENWNRTHRVAGICMVAAGIVVLVNAFIGYAWVMIAAALLAVLIPGVYSYCLYRRKM